MDDVLVWVRRHQLSGNKMNLWVFPCPKHMRGRAVSHPLAELYADSGPIAALAAQKAVPLSVPAGGIGIQLAPAPACGHRAKGAVLQVMAVPFDIFLLNMWAMFAESSASPYQDIPNQRTTHTKESCSQKLSKSLRGSHSFCTQISP